ncbi:fluoride efflux transporter CrcB [Methylocaldum sp.]|uniref:fluoride efflux transporter CrcB n=1 Tax=Methylocaldum sp. TaxID=1969727 RepID=UPI002D4F96B5|nr:fluoride efflux transporter CrcB [Methylocaldum sp.]HYE34667.1 fluoride efflux transporter CrcB [Methylocaldum sp.]
MMGQLFAIALGGSVGAVARYLIATGIYAWLGRAFPHGTLFVNVSGSFLMGFLTELMLQRFSLAVEYRAAILVGFLGAYTTFSTFALETLYLFEEGNLAKAGLNILLSTVLCLAAVWIGLVLGRQLFAADLYPWLGHGFPYGGLALALMIAFVLAAAAEFVFHYFDLSVLYRAIILVSLLGVMTLAATLWLAFQLSEIRLEFQGLLSIFAVNALLGVAAVWLGTLMGNWLWHISKSP